MLRFPSRETHLTHPGECVVPHVQSRAGAQWNPCLDFGAHFLNSTRLRRLLSQFLQDRAHYPGSARSVELRFRLNVMDWPGAVERRKFFQVRAERFGGRVKICNLMSAAALSCPPFNTQCKNQRMKSSRNEIEWANSMPDVLCYTLLSMQKKRKIKDQIRRQMCYIYICPHLNSVHWLAWILQQDMPL